MSSVTASPSAPHPAVQLPEPERLWIRYRPRRWAAAPVGRPWLDLARGRLVEGTLGRGVAPGGAPELPTGPLDDVLWVPPVAPEAREARDRAAERVLADGTPVLVQLLPGETSPVAGPVESGDGDRGLAVGGLAVVDLLDPLLAWWEGQGAGADADPLAVLERLEPGSVAVWPLIPGVTDGDRLWAEAAPRLSAAGLAVLQAVRPELTPKQKRRLAEDRGPEVFDALFHASASGAAAERRWVRRAHRAGFEPFVPRPLPRPPLSGAAGREAVGLLALAAELSLRLGRAGRGQAHLRAARWIDRTDYDLQALAREGNLPVLPWLDDASRAIVEEWAREGRSRRVDDLLDRYLDGDVGEPAGTDRV